MPADDGRVTTSGSINGEVIDVVNDENANPANFHRSGLGQSLSPNAMVDITPNRRDRSNLQKTVEDLRLTNISCVDDQFGALESLDGFGTQQTVGIGDNANEMGLGHVFKIYDTRLRL